jgi:hypothetical protein
MKNYITIQCWSGKILFIGSYKDKQVDKILDINRCHCEVDDCKMCDDTGYKTDFEVFWNDENNQTNVYEYINY